MHVGGIVATFVGTSPIAAVLILVFTTTTPTVLFLFLFLLLLLSSCRSGVASGAFPTAQLALFLHVERVFITFSSSCPVLTEHIRVETVRYAAVVTHCTASVAALLTIIVHEGRILLTFPLHGPFYTVVIHINAVGCWILRLSRAHVTTLFTFALHPVSISLTFTNIGPDITLLMLVFAACRSFGA